MIKSIILIQINMKIQNKNNKLKMYVNNLKSKLINKIRQTIK